jgi:hypothetical protein
MRRMDWKRFDESGRGLIEVLSKHLPGGTEENHEETSVITGDVPFMFPYYRIYIYIYKTNETLVYTHRKNIQPIP